MEGLDGGERAQATLEAAGFERPGARASLGHRRGRRGRSGPTRGEGTQVERGAAVDAVRQHGPGAGRTCPNVVGQTQAAARRTTLTRPRASRSRRRREEADEASPGPCSGRTRRRERSDQQGLGGDDRWSRRGPRRSSVPDVVGQHEADGAQDARRCGLPRQRSEEGRHRRAAGRHGRPSQDPERRARPKRAATVTIAVGRVQPPRRRRPRRSHTGGQRTPL